MTNTDLDFLTGEVDNADREDVDETDDRRDGGLDRRTSLTSLTSSFGGSNSTRPFSKSSISSGVRRLMTTLHGFGRFGGGWNWGFWFDLSVAGILFDGASCFGRSCDLESSLDFLTLLFDVLSLDAFSSFERCDELSFDFFSLSSFIFFDAVSSPDDVFGLDSSPDEALGLAWSPDDVFVLKSSAVNFAVTKLLSTGFLAALCFKIFARSSFKSASESESEPDTIVSRDLAGFSGFFLTGLSPRLDVDAFRSFFGFSCWSWEFFLGRPFFFSPASDPFRSRFFFSPLLPGCRTFDVVVKLFS
jgi:hypothetical protein